MNAVDHVIKAQPKQFTQRAGRFQTCAERGSSAWLMLDFSSTPDCESESQESTDRFIIRIIRGVLLTGSMCPTLNGGQVHLTIARQACQITRLVLIKNMVIEIKTTPEVQSFHS
jgi:hypothetical protein